MIGVGVSIAMAAVNAKHAAAIPSFLGLAATRTRPVGGVASANRQTMTRSYHVATGPIPSLKIAWGSFTIRLAASETLELGDQTITASVEYPAGTFTQLTFGGAVQGSVLSGGVIFSDMSAPVNIPDGADFWINMYIVSTGIGSGTAQGSPQNTFLNSAKGEKMRSAVSGQADFTMGGTWTGDGSHSLAPLAILAYTNKKSVYGFGDSKTFGQADTAESASASGPGFRGEIFRSFAPLGDTLAFTNFASPGAQAWDFVNTSGPNYWAARRQLFPFYTHFVVNIGRNDIWQRKDTQANITANTQAIINAIIAAQPSAKITLATQTHASTSTDNWATTTNQALPSSGATYNSRRSAINAAIRAGMYLSIPAANYNGYFEIADLVETARDSSIWPADGTTAFLNTGDGIHESPLMYAAIASSGNVNLSKFS